jgi:HEAT repeat protein
VPADLDQRSLDDLWTMACLWQVGSNRDVVPAARAELVRRGAPVLDWLIPGRLSTSDSLVTRALEDVIQGIGADLATPRLLPELGSEDAATRRNAASLLGLLGAKEAAPAIADLLSDPDSRLGALSALGALREPSAVPAIVALARSDAPERARSTAVSTLGAIGGAAAERELVVELASPVAVIRFAAQYALEKLRAVDALRGALRAGTRRVVLHALAALGRIGDARARLDVIAHLGDASPQVRGFAADALGAMLTEPARAILRQALAAETDGFARTKMQQALER